MLAALTSLRFFAAAAIVIHHGKNSMAQVLAPFEAMPLGSAVSLFFVLSGFILTYVHRGLGREPSAVRRFYVARIARLWPAHVATFLLFLLVIPSAAWFAPGGEILGKEIAAANLAMVHAWIPIPAFYFSFNGVSWSISAELFFYLMFPLLVQKWNATWHWKMLLMICWSFLFALTAERLNAAAYGIENMMKVTFHGLIYISPFARIYEFVVGMCAAQAYSWLAPRLRLRPAVWGALEAAALYALVAAWPLTSWVIAHGLGSGGGGAMGLFLSQAIPAWAFFFLILVLAMSNGPLARLLSLRWLVLLGEASYCLYLVHQLILTGFVFHPSLIAGLSEGARFVLYAALSVVLAIALWRLVEIPCRRAIIVFSQREGRSVAPATPPSV